MHHRNVLSFLTRASLIVIAASLLHGKAYAEAPDSLSLSPASALSLPEAAATPGKAGDNGLTVQEIAAAPPVAECIDLTIPPDNIWDRIRNGFAMTNLNDDLVLYYQQWYMNRPEALRRMVERSRPYLHYIVQEIEARGMPTELALLPMVESAFNPMAYSRAHASGLWQFIPATGKRFNLEQNWWQDDRRDIVASTGAALDYLQGIYDMHGDWHLALASYNWGEGAVKRAVDKNSARDMPTDYASLNMPNETRHYVPKLQALKNIFGNPVLVAELQLPKITNQPYFATLATEQPIDIKTAARLANMPVEEFRALNPAHNRPVIRADSSIVLPTDKLDTFRSNLEKYASPLTEWQAYTLKNGEKLSKVAPRFGLSVDDLMRINGLNGKTRLGDGTTLLVPSGRGGLAIDETPYVPPPVQVAENRKSGKSARKGKETSSRIATKETRGSKKQAAKGGSTRQAAKPSKNAPVAKAGNSGKAAPKTAGKAADKSAGKTASAKAANPKKIAKSPNGRPG